jgi:hypothetical protein
MMIEQTFISDRGRKRRRLVPVDLGAIRRGLAVPTAADRRDWEQIRGVLRDKLGESRFEIWLGRVELIAIDSDRRLVLAVPAATAGWMRERFGRLLMTSSSSVDREMRFADPPELCALKSDTPGRSTLTNNPMEAAG